MKTRLIIVILALMVAPAAEASRRAMFLGRVVASSGAPTPDVLHWKLNEGSGTSLTGDGSSGGDDGVTDAAWTTGASGSGGALFLDGTTDDASTTSTITYGASIITVSMWLKIDATNTARVVAESSSNYTANNHAFIYLIDSSGVFTLGIRGSVGGQFRSENFAIGATNTWKNTIAVFDNSSSAGDVRFWVDGVELSPLATTNTKTTSGTFGTYTLFIGARNTTTLFYAGFIDDVRVWNGDQSAYVSQIYASPQ